jgi:heme/copper-type cytochrome/quinol oxidase subunit 2
MVDAEELNLGELRLLETDNRIVLPVGVAVRVLVTSVMFFIVELCHHSQLR